MTLKEAKDFAGWCFGWFGIGVVCVALIGRCSSIDDTDLNAGERSGLALRTDHGTGCQYLETTKGGITPRMNGNKHIGCKP